MFCKKCGAKIESYANHCPFCGEAVATNNVQSTYTSSQPILTTQHRSIGKWILTYLISAIPVVGLIMLIIWATGKKTKSDPTFRNWARSILLMGIIAGAAYLIFTLVMFLLVLV